jgi:hypothetical protein
MSRDVTRSAARPSRLRIPGPTRLRPQRPRRHLHRIGGRGSLRSGPSTMGNRPTGKGRSDEDDQSSWHAGISRRSGPYVPRNHGACSPGKPGPSGRDGPRRLPVPRPRGTSATEPVGRIRRRHRTYPHREHGSSRTSGRREPTRGQALVRSSRRPPGGHPRRVNTAHCHRFRATPDAHEQERHHDGRHHVHMSVLRGATGVGYPRVRQRGGQLALVRCPSVAVAHGRRAPAADGPATKAGSSPGRPATNRPALVASSRAARRRNWCLTGPRAATWSGTDGVPGPHLPCWGHYWAPFVQPRPGFARSAGPPAIDEDTGAVIRVRFVVVAPHSDDGVVDHR